MKFPPNIWPTDPEELDADQLRAVLRCAGLLTAAYAHGELAAHMKWEHVDIAFEALQPLFDKEYELFVEALSDEDDEGEDDNE